MKSNIVHLWPRTHELSNQEKIKEDDPGFIKYEANFVRQLQYRFNEVRETEASLLEALGDSMLLRSGEDPIDLLDPEACEMETSSIRRLSRMMFEDIITAEVGSKFKLYVSNSAYENEYGWWKDKLRYVIDTL